MQIITNEQLLFLLAQKDNKAFRHLYSIYYTALKTLALNYVKDETAAEDLAQEVFIALLDTNQSFENLNEIRFFLYGTLKNKSISLLRKNKVRRMYVEEVANDELVLNSFEDKVLEEDVYTRLMSAIEKLPPRCKLVMELSLNGLKRIEISNKLSISIETVKEHRTYGKKRLAELLKQCYTLFV